MQLLQQSEATAAQRRVFLRLVDVTDGITAETGQTGTIRLSKNGGTDAPSTNSLVEVDATDQPGRYYVELTATELDTVGVLAYSYKDAATTQFHGEVQIVPWDPYDATRMGITALPNANAEAAGGLYTRGTGAGQINQQGNGRIDTDVFSVGASAIVSSSFVTQAITSDKFGTGLIGLGYMSSRGPGVFLDTNAANTNTQLGIDGIAFNPVSTLVAAKSIANSLSASRIYLVNGSLLTVGATEDIDGYEIVGELQGGASESTIAFAAGATADFSAIYDLNINNSAVFGTADVVRFVRCYILTDVSGATPTFENCRFFPGTITVTPGTPAAARVASFLECSQLGTAGLLLLDLSAATTPRVLFHGFRGNVRVTNGTGGPLVSIDAHGTIDLQSSNTTGTYIVTGSGTLTNNTTGSATVSDRRVIGASSIASGGITAASFAANAITASSIASDALTPEKFSNTANLPFYDGPHGPGAYYDDFASNTGTVVGDDGTPSNPVSTLAAAKAIANSLGVKRIYIIGTLLVLVAENLTGYECYGISATATVVFQTGSTATDARFEELLLAGSIGTSLIRCFNCTLYNLSVGALTAYSCAIADSFTFKTATTISVLHQCFTVDRATSVVITATGGVDYTIYGFVGDLALAGANSGGRMVVDTNGKLTLNASMTAGTLDVYGINELIDNSAGATINDRRGQHLTDH